MRGHNPRSVWDRKDPPEAQSRAVPPPPRTTPPPPTLPIHRLFSSLCSFFLGCFCVSLSSLLKQSRDQPRVGARPMISRRRRDAEWTRGDQRGALVHPGRLGRGEILGQAQSMTMVSPNSPSITLAFCVAYCGGCREPLPSIPK